MSLNINDFNIRELFDFLEINEKTPSFTIVQNKIDGLKEKVGNNKELLNFLNNAEEKIKNYYENQNNKISHLGNKSFTINNLQYDNYKQHSEQSKSDSEDDNNSEKYDIEEINNEESDNEENNDTEENNIQDDNIENINDPRLIKLLNSRPTKLLKKETILNINTNNRILTTILPDNLKNPIDVIRVDSGHSFYKLPIVLKNVTEMKLIDIEIKYNSLSIVSDFRNNNTFSISSDYILKHRTDHLKNKDSKIDFTIYPLDNSQESLQNSINKVLDICGNKKVVDLSFIKFDISLDFCIFDFSVFFSNLDNSSTSFEIIFPNTNYNLMSVLGFEQAKGINKLYIDYYSNFSTNYGNYPHVIIGVSPIELFLDRIYFALDENVQNSQNNNLLLVSENQLSRYKVLSKLTLSYSNNNKISATYILKNSDIIKSYNNTRKYDGPIDINSFHIDVIDDFDNKIFLNYKNFSFSLLFKSTYNYIKNFKNINY